MAGFGKSYLDIIFASKAYNLRTLMAHVTAVWPAQASTTALSAKHYRTGHSYIFEHSE